LTAQPQSLAAAASSVSIRQQILGMAWPVFIGQLAVMLNGLIDTVMAASLGATDLAGIGLGASIYITVYVSLMGVLLALQPIIAQHHGGGRKDDVVSSVWAGLWLVPLLSIPGCLVLFFNEPLLALTKAPVAVQSVASDYLGFVAFGLPAALLFRVFYALNTAVSRPKVTMALNLVAVLIKIPLNSWFMMGGAGLDPLGGAGCGLATTVIGWLLVGASAIWIHLDPWYSGFGFWRSRQLKVQPIAETLKLGIPMALGYGFEVASFTFMALLLARQGEIVAGAHQIASNLVALCYMVALGLSSATSVLVAQNIGAGNLVLARQFLGQGAQIAISVALVLALLVVLGRDIIAALYSPQPLVQTTAAGLLVWAAAYHLFDAIQTFFVYQLRAYKVALVPMTIYLLALWGVGLGGGWWLTYEAPQGWSTGAYGFWIAAVASLLLASVALLATLRFTVRHYPLMKWVR
jgi:multidrug resistance protein, MATE family